MAYAPLGIAYGVLVSTSGINWYWTPLSALAIFAGSIEFLSVGLAVSGVPIGQVALTALVVNFRHIFYGLSFPIGRLSTKPQKVYGVFALTDETYGIVSGAGSTMSGREITALQVISHGWWMGGARVVRPFAPSVLAEDAGEYFELDHASPYMLLVADVSKGKRLPTTESTFEGLDLLRVPRSTIPAVTHVDFSARLQTVAEADNPTYYRLISEFKQLTGCPVVVNTSFNVRGEPIVNRPEEAYTCFMRTNMDYLAIGGFLLDKASQPPFNEPDEWRTQIPLD